MKNLFLLMAMLSATLMANSQKLLNQVQRNGATDRYPLITDSLIRGGYQAVANVADRNAIYPEMRKEGMKVFVLADSTEWVLRGGLTNNDWRRAIAPVTTPTLDQVAEAGRRTDSLLLAKGFGVYDEPADAHVLITGIDGGINVSDHVGQLVFQVQSDALSWGGRSILNNARLKKNREYFMPDSSGIIPMRVNGVGPDSTGNILLSMSGGPATPYVDSIKVIGVNVFYYKSGTAYLSGTINHFFNSNLRSLADRAHSMAYHSLVVDSIGEFAYNFKSDYNNAVNYIKNTVDLGTTEIGAKVSGVTVPATVSAGVNSEEVQAYLTYFSDDGKIGSEIRASSGVVEIGGFNTNLGFENRGVSRMSFNGHQSYWRATTYDHPERPHTINLWGDSVVFDAGGYPLDLKFRGLLSSSSSAYKFVVIDPVSGRTYLSTLTPGSGGTQGPAGPQGEKGDKGDQGNVGATGAQGIQGIQGNQGLQGPKGDTGAQGDKGDTGSTGAQGLQGEKGDKGDQGTAGTPGATGSQGIQGVEGPKGDKGDQGNPGTTGAQGIQGLQGSKGDKGDTGTPGANGQGVPSGGLQYQFLVKASNNDFDTYWETFPETGSGTTPTLQQVLQAGNTASTPIISSTTVQAAQVNINNSGANVSLRTSGTTTGYVAYLPERTVNSTVTVTEATSSLTDAATIIWDVQSGTNRRVTLGGNRVLTISNAYSGLYATLVVVQDGVGSRTLTLPSGSKVAGGGAGAVTLTTAPGGVDILSFYYDGTNYYWNLSKNYN